MVNVEARKQMYTDLEPQDINRSAVEDKMTSGVLKMARRFDELGILALYAKNKGGGFWVKGYGYMPMKSCKRLWGVK